MTEQTRPTSRRPRPRTIRRFAGMALVAAVVVLPATVFAVERYDDVSLDDVHREDIDWLAEHGITIGCEATRFCPSEPVTRSQLASFLRRFAESGVADLTDSAVEQLVTPGPAGPMGPQGPAGPAGPQGEPGASGYEQVKTSIALSDDEVRSATVTCPDDKRVLGGGYTPFPDPPNTTFVVLSNGPADDHSWTVQVLSMTAPLTTLDVFAICADIDPAPPAPPGPPTHG